MAEDRDKLRKYVHTKLESDVCYCVQVAPPGESYGGNCRPGGK